MDTINQNIWHRGGTTCVDVMYDDVERLGRIGAGTQERRKYGHYQPKYMDSSTNSRNGCHLPDLWGGGEWVLENNVRFFLLLHSVFMWGLNLHSFFIHTVSVANNVIL